MTGFLSDTSCPLVGGEHDRDRPVVLDADTHDGSKAPCLGFYSALPKALNEVLIELLRARGISSLQEARPSAAAHVGGHPEQGNDQRLPGDGRPAQAHPPRPPRQPAAHADPLRPPPPRGVLR